MHAATHLRRHADDERDADDGVQSEVSSQEVGGYRNSYYYPPGGQFYSQEGVILEKGKDG